MRIYWSAGLAFPISPAGQGPVAWPPKATPKATGPPNRHINVSACPTISGEHIGQRGRQEPARLEGWRADSQRRRSLQSAAPRNPPDERVECFPHATEVGETDALVRTLKPHLLPSMLHRMCNLQVVTVNRENENGRKIRVFGEILWRRGRDSNPRYPCEYAAFRVRCIRPLCHLSARSWSAVAGAAH